MSFGFRRSLTLGQLGETLYFQANCKHLERLDGKEGDFVVKATGEKVELKSDYYPMAATQNFFIERFSNKETQSPGSLWQAKQHGCTMFVYLFISDLLYYSFNVDQLIERLEPILPTLQTVDVPNKSFTTLGYRVPRTLVEDLATVSRMEVRLAKPRR